ncbi:MULTISPECIES: phage regulatory CII family protein [Rodentibacter]|uniref:Uncharacterized protein n=1 Tax=Rodentibacter pneumotropicus TaxID=758 RepID=A0A1V3K5W4_9PAST|nr:MULTISPECIES: phage regulatory CII family protein [Pasteurellaceae]OOF56168.1 hypothetical protein BKK56_04085 [Rodentibacter genomosp. 2]MCR1838686.1 hypothetical protein [Pasteurella caecimuris]MCU0108162.1 hypothetical protein [Pasteurella caecimuris]NBH76296.1 hypothetical protein [Rodentibacter pneumotropicus]OOF68507.1 hypothetical protein BKG95_03660 [Rodentibacter pneumotropicus]
MQQKPFSYIQKALHTQAKGHRAISNLAVEIGKNPTQLAAELDPTNERNKLGFLDAVYFIVQMDAKNIVEMLARTVDCTLLPMPECKRNTVDQLREVLSLSAQAGKLCGKYSRSISPDSELGENLSQKEKSELLDILNRLQDSVQCLKWELGE